MFGGTEEAPKAKAKKIKEPSRAGSEIPIGITTQHLRNFVEGGELPDGLLAEAKRLTDQYQFFHFHLAFPEVFANGGFDVILGNPPWDKIQPEEETFFALVRRDIAEAKSAKVRKDLIAELPVSDPPLNEKWLQYKRHIFGIGQFIKSSTAFRLSGEGNLNAYRNFTEQTLVVLGPRGRAGMIVQAGLATDETGKELFDFLMQQKRLILFLGFENKKGFFADVHPQFRFCLLTVGGKQILSNAGKATFGWLLHDLDEMTIPNRLVEISASDIALFNPSSKTCPVFLSERDFSVSKRVYTNAHHVWISEQDKFGGIDFLGEFFNMTRDAKLFHDKPVSDDLPLYEAKYFFQFDHRYTTFENQTLREISVDEKISPATTVRTKSYVSFGDVQSRIKSIWRSRKMVVWIPEHFKSD